MAKFIPKYQSPEEQARLEDKFFTFIKYVSLEGEQDYKVNVSEKDGVVSFKPLDIFSYLKGGAVSTSNTAKDGTKVDITSIQRINRERVYGSTRLSHDLEIIIDGDKFILRSYSCLSS